MALTGQGQTGANARMQRGSCIVLGGYLTLAEPNFNAEKMGWD
jgi:hypothetical protein